MTIYDLAHLVAEVIGFKGEIVCDLSRPDGTPRKLMNGDRLRTLGWEPSIGLPEGIANVYRAFLSNAECVNA